MKKSIFISTLLVLAIFNESVAQNNDNNLLPKQTVALNFPCTNSGIIEMHPNENDFTSGKEGRIMISTLYEKGDYKDTKYYASNNSYDYQTEDNKIKIRAVLSASQAGTTVYFRAVSPDLDDLSSYETEDDASIADNADPDIKEGKLSQPCSSGSTISCAEVDADGFAEVELTFTDQYSGDNYQVEASLSNDFTDSKKTMIMVAWKRAYVEYDCMYKKGATLREKYEADIDNNNDMIKVDNSSDFAVGDLIEIFQSPLSAIISEEEFQPISVTVTAIPPQTPPNQIEISDPGGNIQYVFLGGDGVKIKDELDYFEVSSNLVTDAFGGLTNGSDGGAFVEFDWETVPQGFLPKYTSIPNEVTLAHFTTFWRDNNCDPLSANFCPNYIHLVIANDWVMPTRGSTNEMYNVSVLFDQNFDNDNAISNKEIAKAETLAHEFGHQFGLLATNPDLPAVHDVSTENYPNHDNTDQGLMTYDRDPDDGIAEFFIDCIIFVRNAVDSF